MTRLRRRCRRPRRRRRAHVPMSNTTSHDNHEKINSWVSFRFPYTGCLWGSAWRPKYNLYLPSAVFIAQVLLGPSKQRKQIIQTEHNTVKNANWPDAKQLATYKRGRGFELGATEKQYQVVVRAGLEPGTAGLPVRHADHSATLSPLKCHSI